MTATSSMQRLWLAVLCLLAVAVVPCGAREVKLIDRKPVAHGAEVVMEVELELEPDEKDGPASFYRYSYRTPTGIDWVFYREPVDYKKPYDWTSFEKNALPALKFNDRRVSLFLIDWYDCIVVTVELDPAAPKVHEDRFSDSYGHGLHHAELVGADELELTDPDDRIFTTKRLKRDREGAWWFAGIPYEKKCWSRVLIFTREHQLSQVLQNPPAEEWVGVKQPSGLRIIADPFSAVFSAQPPPAEFIEVGPLPANMAKMERLKGIHRSFIRRKARGLTPTMDGGPDLPMPSMVELVIQNLNDADNKKYDCGWAGMRGPSSMGMQMARDYFEKDGWITAADLPCFNTDYDKTLRDICATYDLWLEYCDSRLLKSLRGVHTAGFFTFFEWEMTGESEEREKALESRGLPARTHTQHR